MTTGRTQALVVVDAAAAGRGMPSGPWTVVSALPPRVFVVELDASALNALHARPGVSAWSRASDAEEGLSPLPPLNDAETLFVKAWQASGKKEGARKGDALPWDAAGFVPPDRAERR